MQARPGIKLESALDRPDHLLHVDSNTEVTGLENAPSVLESATSLTARESDHGQDKDAATAAMEGTEQPKSARSGLGYIDPKGEEYANCQQYVQDLQSSLEFDKII